MYSYCIVRSQLEKQKKYLVKHSITDKIKKKKKNKLMLLHFTLFF